MVFERIEIFLMGTEDHVQRSPSPQRKKLRKSILKHFDGPPITSCRHVDNYEKLNRIEEGSYGVVYRAKDMATGEIVALKKLKYAFNIYVQIGK